MSPWAFCSEEQVREGFFSASVVFGGHSPELRPNSTCLFVQGLFFGKRDRYQPIGKPERLRTSRP